LFGAARNGDRRALAQLLSAVERDEPGIERVLEAALPHARAAHVVGITGAPGVGKSTLAAALARELRTSGERVAIVAVDPSSPHTGGALLGDRVRMAALHDDPGVFVRSLASRGAAGGLADAAAETALVLAACGYAHVLVETVGAGQGELDVATECDTTLLVVAPGLGDEVQALKAGIVEVADVIAVNKADRDEADRLVADLAFARESHDESAPVLKTVATSGEGVPELAAALRAHRTAASARPSGRRQRLAERRVLRAAAQLVLARLAERAGAQPLAELGSQVAARRLTSRTAARRLLDHVGLAGPPP
ncbi:MAG TPA: methylmalonyl Co-A mutase-associated GTPase MeaB, partial [Chloroflexota bacterium]|nr:methylmalonyl Co-A mutase-associated GTPase MeaB [Chloroflexota bacterium]